MSSRDGRDTGAESRTERWRSDRTAVGTGTAVTALATIGFFLLPELVGPFSSRYGLAVEQLRWFGGAVGATAAGALTPDHGSGLVTGTKAAVYGLGVAYLTAVVLYFGYAVVALGVFPPPGLALVAVLVYYAIPLMITYSLGGVLFGRLGRRLRDVGE